MNASMKNIINYGAEFKINGGKVTTLNLKHTRMDKNPFTCSRVVITFVHKVVDIDIDDLRNLGDLIGTKLLRCKVGELEVSLENEIIKVIRDNKLITKVNLISGVATSSENVDILTYYEM